MPPTVVVFFRDERGEAPALHWLDDVRQQDRKAFANCAARIHLLAESGNDLRRPTADYLRDGIYELRTRRGRVHYRILYCFHGQGTAVLLHGLKKQGQVPRADIERAIERRSQFELAPGRHTHEEPIDNG